MMRRKKIATGFTLIELLVVVIIIGVLVVATYPNFEAFVTRAKLKELENTVQLIAAAEKYYFFKNGTYRTFQLGAYDSNNSYGTAYNAAIETDLNITLPKEPSAFCAYGMWQSDSTPFIVVYVPSCTGYQDTILYSWDMNQNKGLKSYNHPYRVYITGEQVPAPAH